jgi:NAD(P)-dependent dehydrogenase (short-subunit alcohol dehydrogenase family)
MLDEGVEALDALGAFVDRWLSAVDSDQMGFAPRCVVKNWGCGALL